MNQNSYSEKPRGSVADAVMAKPKTRSQKIALSGLILAIYIVIMYFSQSFAFGAYQVRIATALYALAYIHPFLVLPLGLANGLVNMLMGGFGFFDIFGGFAAGIITAGICAILGRRGANPMWCFLPVMLGPGLIVSTWLAYLLHIPYPAMALSLCIGQIIPAIAGVVMIKALRGKI